MDKQVIKLMIQVNQLTFRIKKRQILNNIGLSVDEGSFFALAGVNGAGKSTLIKLTLDLLRTSEESMILVDGVSSWQVSSRDHLSYLPEKFHVTKSVTGFQYCQFVLGVYRQKMDKAYLYQLCEQLDFKVDDLAKNVNSYSKGMMQKLGLMSNFILQKPLMILDEPLSGLDPKARYCLKALLQEKKKQGLTLFYSTHMLADAEEVCDQFGILDEGYLKFVGTPEHCLNQYQADTLEKAYMNCIA